MLEGRGLIGHKPPRTNARDTGKQIFRLQLQHCGPQEKKMGISSKYYGLEPKAQRTSHAKELKMDRHVTTSCRLSFLRSVQKFYCKLQILCTSHQIMFSREFPIKFFRHPKEFPSVFNSSSQSPPPQPRTIPHCCSRGRKSARSP